MSDIGVWQQGYAPAECERGKFIALDNAVLTTLGYPTTGGRGKYALLTYNVNGVTSGNTSSIVKLQAPDTTVLAGGANNLFSTTPTTITFTPVKISYCLEKSVVAIPTFVLVNTIAPIGKVLGDSFS